MNVTKQFAVCSFCILFQREMEERELDAEEALMYRHHMRVEHGMTI
jgi:hypothetical protein